MTKENRIRDLYKVDMALKQLTCDHQFWWGVNDRMEMEEEYCCVFCGLIKKC